MNQITRLPFEETVIIYATIGGKKVSHKPIRLKRGNWCTKWRKPLRSRPRGLLQLKQDNKCYFVPSNNWSVTLFSQGSAAFYVADRRLMHIQIWSTEKKFHHFAGGHRYFFFFLTTFLINGEKFAPEHIGWNKCALTWKNSFHNQNCRERIASIAKRTWIAWAIFDTPTYVNHMTWINKR